MLFPTEGPSGLLCKSLLAIYRNTARLWRQKVGGVRTTNWPEQGAASARAMRPVTIYANDFVDYNCNRPFTSRVGSGTYI